MENLDDIKEMAHKCLNCKAKPCSESGCPMETNIPEFILNIKEEKFEEAYKILNYNNIFSYVCSLVCPQEDQCESACVLKKAKGSTQIGKLEKFVNEIAIEKDYKLEQIVHNKSNQKVAIIGSGPAGLECAYELAKNGVNVTIYEKENECGGLLQYGIPDFRLSKDIVNKVIDILKDLGINFINNTELGKDISIKKLKEKYDSIFIAIGAQKSTVYSLTNDEMVDKIYKSDYFLKQYRNKEYIKNLGNVVVIGGGNVAMDCARCAIRMGAKSVSILYRRDKENMPAREIELQEAIADGVKIEFQTRVISANIKNHNIESLNCIKTEIIDRKAVDIEGSNFEYKADSVVFAIGLKPDNKLLENENIELDEYGLIKINDKLETNIENVYAGGDTIESKSTVCRALATGKKAAKEILNKKDL